MDRDSYSDDEIREFLSLKKIAVVGMSKYSYKDAHTVPKYLIDNGYDVIPVNPTTDEILSRKCFEKVSDIQTDIDIVNVFRPSDQVLDVIEEAISKNPKVIWLQEGIHNPDVEDIARKQGIKVVYNRCMFAEHRRLL